MDLGDMARRKVVAEARQKAEQQALEQQRQAPVQPEWGQDLARELIALRVPVGHFHKLVRETPKEFFTPAVREYQVTGSGWWVFRRWTRDVNDFEQEVVIDSFGITDRGFVARCAGPLRDSPKTRQVGLLRPALSALERPFTVGELDFYRGGSGPAPFWPLEALKQVLKGEARVAVGTIEWGQIWAPPLV